MSAILKREFWNVPIGRPNALRCLMNSNVISNAVRASCNDPTDVMSRSSASSVVRW